MAITYDAILDAVAGFFAGVGGLLKVESYDELSESFPQTPMMQVYPEASETDALQDNDRLTFKAGARVTEVVVICDVACRLRSHSRDDMKAAVDMMEALQNKLETIRNGAPFGLEGLKSVRWSLARATFPRSSGEPFVGVQAKIVVRCW